MSERPAYRAVLDAQGVRDPADVALIGDESAVAAGLEAYTEAGATDFAASILADSDDELERTYQFLCRRTSNTTGP